jgi:hypothetical protein
MDKQADRTCNACAVRLSRLTSYAMPDPSHGGGGDLPSPAGPGRGLDVSHSRIPCAARRHGAAAAGAASGARMARAVHK